MKYKVFGKTKLKAQLYGILKYDYFHYPHAEEGPYRVFGNGASKIDSLLWAYKCWIHQMEKAERGYGLEQFFAGQDLSFPLPEGFQEQSRYTLASAGDLMAVDSMCYEYTEHLFDELKEFLFDADISCANLESTVNDNAPIGRNQSKFVPARINTSRAMLERFWDGGRGINFFATANNHTWDYKEEGVRKTLEVLDSYGVYHTGSQLTKEEQEDVLIIEKNGIKTAMLNWTFDLNGYQLEENQKHFVNEVRFNDKETDLSMCMRHIQKAKEKGADIIIATIHWGWEFEMYPHKKTVDIAHQLIEAGVDVILGGHPHVAEPMEKYTCTDADGRVRQGLVVYSLGDFVTYHPLSKDSKLTFVVRFEVVKGTLNGKPCTQITNFKMMPVYILAEEKSDGTYDCRLLKFYNILNDKPVNGKYKYNLDPQMRKDLPRLEKLLYKIVLPRNYKGVLYTGCEQKGEE